MVSTTAPLVSLCMIVKDEADLIRRAIESAMDLADEIVVHDTGSTDGTQEIARSLGATVIEGTWHGDFGRARNTALGHCSGTWIAWIDADEELVADVESLRAHLRGLRRVDALQVEIHNVGAASGAYSHRADRIFRRTRARWSGALHEHVVRRDGSPMRTAPLRGAHIRHHGYAADLVIGRDKIQRNLEVARQALDADDVTGVELGRRHLNVARSLSLAGDDAAAVDHFVAATEHLSGAELAFASRRAGETFLNLRRFSLARTWLDSYAELAGPTELVTYLRALVDFHEHGAAEQLASIDPGRPLVAEAETVAMDKVRDNVTDACLVSRRWERAAELLGEMVVDVPLTPRWPDAVVATFEASAAAGSDPAVAMDHLVSRIPDDPTLRAIVPQLTLATADAREALAHALVRRFGDAHPAVVAFVAGHANRLDNVEHMLPWATMLRTSPFDVPCPVVARAQDPTVEPTQRFLAAASAHAAFGEPGALELLFEISELLRPEEEADAAFILTEIAPDLVVD